MHTPHTHTYVHAWMLLFLPEGFRADNNMSTHEFTNPMLFPICSGVRYGCAALDGQHVASAPSFADVVRYVRPKPGPIWLGFDGSCPRYRSAKTDRVRPNPGQVRPRDQTSSSEMGQVGPMSTGPGPHSTDVGQIRPKLGQVDPIRGRFRPMSAKYCPMSTDAGPNLAVGRNSTEVGQTRPGGGQIRPDFDRNWTEFGQVSANLGPPRAAERLLCNACVARQRTCATMHLGALIRTPACVHGRVTEYVCMCARASECVSTLGMQKVAISQHTRTCR